MLQIYYNDVLPIVLIFAIGYILKCIGLLEKSHGEALLKIVFNVCLPALVFVSILSIEIEHKFIILPFVPVIAEIIVCCTAYSIGKFILKLDRRKMGTFLVGAMVMNVSFIIPFFIVKYGVEKIGLMSFLDIGGAFFTFTFVYYIAVYYGGTPKEIRILPTVVKTFTSPPIVAFFLGLFFRIICLTVPLPILSMLNQIGSITGPLVMLALGLLFHFHFAQPFNIFCVLLIRIGIGFAVGMLFVIIFDLQGIARAIILLATSAPSGFTTLTFTVIEGLDSELAVGIVSLSIIIGMITVPVVLYLC